MSIFEHIKHVTINPRTRVQCASLVWGYRTKDKKGTNNAARHLLSQIINNGGKTILYKGAAADKFRNFFGGYYPNIYGDLFIFADILINAGKLSPRLERLKCRYLHTVGALACFIRPAIRINLTEEKAK